MRRSFRRAALLVAGTAMAAALPVTLEAADQTVDVTATATPFCSFTANPVFSGLENIAIDSASTPTAVVHVPQPVDTGGFMKKAKFTFNIATTCNAPSKYQLRTQNGGLKNFGPPPVSGTWLNHINYSAHLTWPGALGTPTVLITNGTSPDTSDEELQTVAHSGNVLVSFAIQQDTSAPLAGGNYTDILTIAVNPQ